MSGANRQGPLEKAPAFQLYARDFLIDETAALSLAATGAYAKLLCHQWINGPLPNSPAKLARLLGVATKVFRPVWREVQHLFEVLGDDKTLRANIPLLVKHRELLAYRLEQRAHALRQHAANGGK